MTDYLTLTEFIPGTKAKAQEVNANFSALKDAVNSKAALQGNNLQTFNVADAIEDSHAVNQKQLNNLSDDLIAEINKASARFCVKSGNVTNGNGDLFNFSGLTITPKIGGTYSNLIISDYKGEHIKISSALPSVLNLTGNSNGTYNIFINNKGELYILNNTIYKQTSRPTMVVNDVWFNISREPFECIKYNGTADVEFLDVPLGKVTITNSAISAIETFPFNQNGYDVTTQSKVSSGTNLATSIINLGMPNYANGVSKTWATVYQADIDGYVYVSASFGSTLSVSTNNSTWHTVQYSWHSDQGYSTSSFVPIPKGTYYKATGGNAGSLVFYPCLVV